VSTKGAAAALHVTPPAIALQLRELEASVEVPLIERRLTQQSINKATFSIEFVDGIWYDLV
jgi:DNA-binding transcriptional LysR family regulator